MTKDIALEGFSAQFQQLNTINSRPAHLTFSSPPTPGQQNLWDRRYKWITREDIPSPNPKQVSPNMEDPHISDRDTERIDIGGTQPSIAIPPQPEKK